MRHLIAAGAVDDALDRIPRAAETARDRGQLRDAYEWLTSGLEHLAGGPDPRPELEAWMRTLRATVAASLTKPEQADTDLARARELLDQIGNRENRLHRLLIESSTQSHGAETSARVVNACAALARLLPEADCVAATTVS